MDEIMRGPLLALTRSGGAVEYAAYGEESKRIMREVGVRNMFIRSRLHELLRKLERENIRAIVLKGAHLIHDIYPFGIRPIEDIDLLVNRDDFGKLHRLMQDLGYADNAYGIDLWTHLTFSNKLTYHNDEHPVIPVDIHLSLGPHPYLGRIGHDLLFAHTSTIHVPEGELTVLKPEMLLVHLCLHLFQHHYENWQVSGCDIAAVVRHYPELDWRLFVRLVTDTRLTLPVAYSLRRACELADLHLPALSELEGRPASRFERWIFSSSRVQQSDFDRHVLQFVTTPGFMNKLQCLRRITSPGRSYLRHNYEGSYRRYVRSMTKTAAKALAAVLKGGKRA